MGAQVLSLGDQVLHKLFQPRRWLDLGLFDDVRSPPEDHSVEDGRERTGERPADGTGHVGSPR